jgi:hypothetical protein
MSDLTAFPIISGAASSASGRSLARVEKPSRSSDLHDDTAGREGPREQTGDRLSPRAVSRSGTDDAPRWHGPRLSAPFAAQILGQVLPNSGPDAASARAAYRKPRAYLPAGFCLDDEV